MNRWWGNKDDSEKQASERNSRAARRVINSLPDVDSDSSDVEYNDCDASLNLGIGVDGADDISDDGMPVDAATELARQRAMPVEDSDFLRGRLVRVSSIKRTRFITLNEIWIEITGIISIKRTLLMFLEVDDGIKSRFGTIFPGVRVVPIKDFIFMH